MIARRPLVQAVPPPPPAPPSMPRVVAILDRVAFLIGCAIVAFIICGGGAVAVRAAAVFGGG